MTDATTTVAAGGETSGRPARTTVEGVLFVDLVKIRARYDCFRPGCPQPVESPARGDDLEDFIGGIKTDHLARFHGEHR
ncbi:hypothetical protein [Streptomyces sp. UG1]|uniref:hypothetical protein n=1 Tax=Streptomyces sp. UG1 TaxID=3417652 RepID=UPI003CF2ACDF